MDGQPSGDEVVRGADAGARTKDGVLGGPDGAPSGEPNGVSHGVTHGTPEGHKEDAAEGVPPSDDAAHARAELAAARTRIDQLSGQVRAESMARQLREALEDAGAVRVRDAVRVAQEAASRLTDASPEDLARVIEDVRAAHPEFFGPTRWASTNAPGDVGSSASSGTSPDGADGSGGGQRAVEALAMRARASNDRRALLEYLRARRAK